MSRKPDGTQRSGRGTAPPAAGGFGGADTALTRLARPFVPKPFRSTGGMSTSADTMMSIGMGRHNNDDEMPEDQVNIASIVDRKVSDRRYLPRKLGNMKYYLHTVPINEVLSMDDKIIHRQILLYENDLNELFDNLSTTDAVNFLKTAAGGAADVIKRGVEKLPSLDTVKKTVDSADTGLQIIAPFVPFGDLYFGYRAFNDFRDIQENIDKIEESLRNSGTDISLSDPPEENASAIKSMKIPSAADREVLKNATMKLAFACYNFLVDVIQAIPLSLIPGLGSLDFTLDMAISAITTGQWIDDPDGEKVSKMLIEFSEKYLDEIKKVEDKIAEIGKSAGIDEESLKKAKSISNFIGNLAMIRNEITTRLEAVNQSSEPTVVGESFRRKKKKKKTDEISGVGSIAGYTGPMAGPGNPKKFYPSMARAAGGEYLIDPVKNLKAKP